MEAQRSRLGVLVGAVALATILTGCASSGVRPRPFPTSGGRDGAEVPRVLPPRADTAPAPATSPAEVLSAPISLVQTALSLRGTPYRNGGSTPDGFDCSGFTQWVFAQHGVRIPRETQEQFRLGADVAPGQQRPGDLVFYRTSGASVSHVGILLGDGSFVHAPSSRGVVRIEQMSLPYWQRRFVGIRRLID